MSGDGLAWAAGQVRPITPDGPRSGFLGVAPSAGGVAALGAAFSPIHGNARPLVWRADASGALVEVPITRELFGGPRTIGVAAIAGGSGGFTVVGDYLVGGTWLGGPSVAAPTVWTSATGAVFSMPSCARPGRVDCWTSAQRGRAKRRGHGRPTGV